MLPCEHNEVSGLPRLSSPVSPTYEREATLRRLEVGLESERALLVDLRIAETRLVALVVGEVAVHHVERLLVDLCRSRTRRCACEERARGSGGVD